MDETTWQAQLYDLQSGLADLHHELDVLPLAVRAKFSAPVSSPRDAAQRLVQDAAALKESMDHLRLSVKYIAFDLEATRRENRQLRKLLFSLAIDGPTDGDEGDEGNP